MPCKQIESLLLIHADWFNLPGEESFRREQRSEGMTARRKERRNGWEVVDDETWTHIFSLHPSIPRCLWLHWGRVTTLTVLIISQDCVLLSIYGGSSFCLSAKCNKVVSNWVGHWSDSLPWHKQSDNTQETEVNYINWYTDCILSVA